jgi:heme a synthase
MGLNVNTPVVRTMHPQTSSQTPLCVIYWLRVCMAMVVLMVLVGGLTRLTESGLSMVEWKPLHLLPPMNEMEWAEEFAKYQQSPEFQKVNMGMDVAGFQKIFWLEYIHRLLARTVGLVFFLPLVWFAFRRALPGRTTLKLGGIFVLGGMQGLIGWIMVHSGLQNNPWVNPVKLAMHLSMAILIFSLILWQHQSLSSAPKHSTSTQPRWLRPALIGALALSSVQIILGALVAGMDAGLVYNTYPTMDGAWIPEGLANLQPWWRNAVENVTAIQFHHRIGAHIVLLVMIGLWVAMQRTQATYFLGKARHGLICIMAVQFLLGIFTIIWHVPIAIASAHQLGAVALVGVLVVLLHRACRALPNSLPGNHPHD